MLRKADNEVPVGRESKAAVRTRLTTQVTRWGLEAGLLGVEDHLDVRLTALIKEGSEAIFGAVEAERDRLRAEVAAGEKEWNESVRVIGSYRARYGAGAERLRGGIWRRIRSWMWDYQNYRSACAICRRHAAALPELRRALQAKERECADAAAWRDDVTLSLRATHEYQKSRAAKALTKEENHHDDQHNRDLIIHRAS